MKITKAVIPAAGFGTRVLSSSRASWSKLMRG